MCVNVHVVCVCVWYVCLLVLISSFLSAIGSLPSHTQGWENTYLYSFHLFSLPPPARSDTRRPSGFLRGQSSNREEGKEGCSRSVGRKARGKYPGTAWDQVREWGKCVGSHQRNQTLLH